MSVNKVILIGRLGKDPELKHTAGGGAVCAFSLATSEQWTDKAGQKQERTEWTNISVWGKMADNSRLLQSSFFEFDESLRSLGLQFHRFDFLKPAPEDLNRDEQTGAPYTFVLGRKNPIFYSQFNDNTWYTSPSKTIFDVSNVGYDLIDANGNVIPGEISKVWGKLV